MSVTIPTYQYYTDKPTVLAVQRALKARGVDPGPLDGVMGPKTKAAIVKAGASSSGVIDYGTLLFLGVPVPGAAQAEQAAQSDYNIDEAMRRAHEQAGQVTDYSPIRPASLFTPAAAPATAAVPAASDVIPAQAGAPGATPSWQIAVMLGGGAAVLLGLVMALRKKR